MTGLAKKSDGNGSRIFKLAGAFVLALGMSVMTGCGDDAELADEAAGVDMAALCNAAWKCDSMSGRARWECLQSVNNSWGRSAWEMAQGNCGVGGGGGGNGSSGSSGSGSAGDGGDH